jgi:gamma-glutamyltranspeptidase/glutathione hydrolase
MLRNSHCAGNWDREPPINYCENGFLVRPHVSYYWNLTESTGGVPHIEQVKRLPLTAAIYIREDGAACQ